MISALAAQAGRLGRARARRRRRRGSRSTWCGHGKLDAMTSKLRRGGSDSIILTGLRVRAHHGVFDFERANGQDFVDRRDGVARPRRAPRQATTSPTTVHYGELAVEVADAVRPRPGRPHRDARRARRGDRARAPAGRSAVEVTVHKPDAPIERAVRRRRRAHRRGAGRDRGARSASRQRLRRRRARRARVRQQPGRPGSDHPAARAPRSRERRASDVDAVSPLYETPALKLDGVDHERPPTSTPSRCVHTTARAAWPARRGQRRRGRAAAACARSAGATAPSTSTSSTTTASSSDDDRARRCRIPAPRERAFVLVPWLAGRPGCRARRSAARWPTSRPSATDPVPAVREGRS